MSIRERTVLAVANALKREAETVATYTQGIMNTSEAKDTAFVEVKATLEKLRLDDVEHIQNICIKLTELLTQEEAAETMERKEE